MRFMETGKESPGLYYLDNKPLGSSCFVCNRSKSSISKLTWHNMFGRSVDYTLNVLENILNFGNNSIFSWDVCHKANKLEKHFL